MLSFSGKTKKGLLVLLLAGQLVRAVDIPVPVPGVKIDVSVGGGIALALTIYAGYKLYVIAGGTKSFNQFMREAYAKSTQAVNAQEKANKVKMGKNYKKMTDDEVAAIREETYQHYITGESARLLGVNGDALRSYVDSFSGATYADRLDSVQTVVNVLSANAKLEIPGALPNEQPFKSALRFAVQNNVRDVTSAAKQMSTWKETIEINPATGAGPSEEIGAQIGRGFANVRAAARDVISDGVSTVRDNLPSTAALQKQAQLAKQSYTSTVDAEAQARAADQGANKPSGPDVDDPSDVDLGV